MLSLGAGFVFATLSATARFRVPVHARTCSRCGYPLEDDTTCPECGRQDHCLQRSSRRKRAIRYNLSAACISVVVGGLLVVVGGQWAEHVSNGMLAGSLKVLSFNSRLSDEYIRRVDHGEVSSEMIANGAIHKYAKRGGENGELMAIALVSRLPDASGASSSEFARLVVDMSPLGRRHGAILLGDMLSEPTLLRIDTIVVVDALVELMADSRPGVRSAAAAAIGAAGPAGGRAVPPLQRMRLDKDRYSRTAAEGSLAKMGASLSATLVIDTSDPVGSVLNLENADRSWAVDYCVSLLHDGDAIAISPEQRSRLLSLSVRFSSHRDFRVRSACQELDDALAE